MRSAGVVLTGFPRDDTDARAMVEANMFPDTLVLLEASEAAVVRRLLPLKVFFYLKKTNS